MNVIVTKKSQKRDTISMVHSNLLTRPVLAGLGALILSTINEPHYQLDRSKQFSKKCTTHILIMTSTCKHLHIPFDF